MKVLLIGNYPPPYGGIAVQIQHLRRTLPAQGIECQVLNVDLKAEGNGTPEYHAAGGRIGFVKRLLEFGRSGHLLHLFTNGENWKSWVLVLVVGCVGRLRRVATIATITSGGAPAYLETAQPAARAVARLALRLPTAVVCRTEPIADAIRKWRAKAVSVLAAFSPSRVQPAEQPPQAIVRFAAAHRPLLVSVVILRPEYDLATLLGAFRDLLAAYPTAGLVVVGGGEQEAEVRELVARLGLGESVLLAGWVAHAECLATIRESDLFVRTTVYDGDASSVREALALGVPVVATKTGFRPEGVILVPPGDREALRAGLADVLAGGARPEGSSAPSAASSDGALVALYQRVSERNEL